MKVLALLATFTLTTIASGDVIFKCKKVLALLATFTLATIASGDVIFIMHESFCTVGYIHIDYHSVGNFPQAIFET